MLTRRLQIQVIADMLAGLHPQAKLSDFHEPLKTAFKAVRDAPPDAKTQALVQVLTACQDGNILIGQIVAAVPGGKLSFPSLKDLAADLPPIEWLWRNWIPRGMLSLLGAIPGAGKTYLALDLAWRLIANTTFPDGTPVNIPDACAIFVDAEGLPQLVNERAAAWKMDTSRLYLMTPPVTEVLDLNLPTYQDHLIEMVVTLNPALVVIDSLSSISSKGENNVEDVRNVLAFLSGLASDAHTAMLLIHHLRKRNGLAAMDLLSADDFRGSSHIIAMARSILGLNIIQTGEEQDRNGPRRLDVLKTNLGGYPKPIGIEFLPLEPTGVLLRYGDAPEKYQPPTEEEHCAEWLLQTLRETGPMKPKDVIQLGKEVGYLERMIYRARGSLSDQVLNTAGRKNPENMWKVL